MGVAESRLQTYLHSLSSGQGEYLDKVRRKAEQDAVPIIRVEMESFLQVYLDLLRPSRILEAGTAVGYSSMLMAKQTEEWGCRIDTIEKDQARILKAKENIGNSPWKNRIDLIEGDVREVFRNLAEKGEKYDFLFMDAAKGQYIRYLSDALRLLKRGGLLISDNVLQDMTLLDCRFALERRERTIHKRMRDYLWLIKHTEGLTTSIIPIGDGAAVTFKEKDNISINIDTE